MRISIRAFILKCAVTLSFILPFLLSSCESDGLDPRINFIGDSIAARWDVGQDFPSRNVHNFAVGGTGVSFLEAHSQRFGNQDVVVVSGTNDNGSFSDDARDEYAERFVQAVISLSSGRIFVYSVLPRSFSGDRPGINDDIKKFNDALRVRLSKFDRVTFIDVYSDFMSGNEINIRFFSDGLHLNYLGYEILNQKLRKVI